MQENSKCEFCGTYKKRSWACSCDAYQKNLETSRIERERASEMERAFHSSKEYAKAKVSFQNRLIKKTEPQRFGKKRKKYK